MDEVKTVEDKNSFLQNDRKLVCSMLVVYGLCIVGLVAATIWGLDRRNKAISVNATSTAFAQATQQANATVTAIAHATEQAQYEFIDPFNNTAEEWREWRIESLNYEYVNGSISITRGVYLWNIQEVKEPFSYWASFRQNEEFEDFDVYVDSKIVDSTQGSACSGFIFRTASIDREKGTYTFSICSDATFYVYYYKEEKWDPILRGRYSNAIRNSDWNRLEIQARGNDFNFAINNEVVFKMTDERLPKGGLGLYIEVHEKKPASISFDNFGFQSR